MINHHPQGPDDWGKQCLNLTMMIAVPSDDVPMTDSAEDDENHLFVGTLDGE